jgi:hypothetical protein
LNPIWSLYKNKENKRKDGKNEKKAKNKDEACTGCLKELFLAATLVKLFNFSYDTFQNYRRTIMELMMGAPFDAHRLL